MQSFNKEQLHRLFYIMSDDGKSDHCNCETENYIILIQIWSDVRSNHIFPVSIPRLI